MAKSTAFEVIGNDPLVVRTIYCSDAPDAKKIIQSPWLMWSKLIAPEVRERKKGVIQMELQCPEDAYDVLSEAKRFEAVNGLILLIMGHGFAI